MMGIIYIDGGNGVVPNRAYGISLLTSAAEEEHGRAQYNLGIVYERGIGGSQDNSKALKWYRKALANGVKDAEEGIYRVQCQSVKCRDVMRNPEQYEDKQVTFKGEVIQVSEDGSELTLRIAQGDPNSFSSDIWLAVYFRKQGEGRILEKDYIQVYGECLGITTYESIFGAKVTVPAIHIHHYRMLK